MTDVVSQKDLGVLQLNALPCCGDEYSPARFCLFQRMSLNLFSPWFCSICYKKLYTSKQFAGGRGSVHQPMFSQYLYLQGSQSYCKHFSSKVGSKGFGFGHAEVRNLPSPGLALVGPPKIGIGFIQILLCLMVYPNFVQLSATTDQEYENYLHYINLQLQIFKLPNQKGIKKLDMIYTIYFIPV